jgi:hypothetical protein
MCLAEGACQGMEPARQAHPVFRAGSDSNDGRDACQGSSSATIVSVMIMKAPAPCRERITSPTLARPARDGDAAVAIIVCRLQRCATDQVDSWNFRNLCECCPGLSLGPPFDPRLLTLSAPKTQPAIDEPRPYQSTSAKKPRRDFRVQDWRQTDPMMHGRWVLGERR